MFDSALLPVSFREPVSRLTEMIDFLGNLGARRLSLLHVAAGPVSSSAETRLRQLADSIAETAGVQVGSRVRSGSPAYEIATSADEEGADFICFPWKRKSWIQRTLVGSTTRDVIRLSSLPVLVHKSRAFRADGHHFRVLYPTNFKDTDRFVVPYLKTPGLTADELILLTVRDRAPDPTAESRAHRTCTENLGRLADEVAGNYKKVVQMEVIGNPRRQISRVARRDGADFLVLGKSDRPDALGSMMGSVAEEVANSAPCSVFIIGRAYLPEGGAR
ncbi:MAG: universal stress protein [Spirochaetaceae bacterium]|nr:MAG: universal stress protein [Spirochaetaceae bacterium]